MWDQRIRNDTRFPDQYVADWGAASPALLSGGDASRYFSAFLVHRSWLHFFLLSIAALIAAGFMERRCVCLNSWTSDL
jgi:hypothetical protein